jgi:hypothetical protein
MIAVVIEECPPQWRQISGGCVFWVFGGEIISKLHETPKLRKQPMADVVFAALDDEGGPLLSHHASEEEQRSFNSTCRKFLRFLKDSKSERT